MLIKQIRLQGFSEENLHGRSFVAPNGTKEPYFAGDDRNAPDLLCSQCDKVLVRGVPTALLADLLFQCPDCCGFSEVHISLAQSVAGRR